jgi:hypothetical protein
MSAFLTTAAAHPRQARRGELDLSPFPMEALLSGCVENLRATYDGEQALFPFATTLVDGSFVNDYRHPQAIRYTINSLLGLSEAARYGVGDLGPGEVVAMTESFLTRGAARIETLADAGLLALLLCDYGYDTRPAEEGLTRLQRTLSADLGRGLDLQTLSWSIWGGASAARRGLPAGEDVALRAAGVVREHFFDLRSGLPRHSTRRYRRSIVSFGSLTYFLRAAHELAVTFDDRRWHAAFEAGVERALALQGPLGEWPWMMNVNSGEPFDAYPVFSVHQDSMAMLFLLPALDRGLPGVGAAIERSLAWCFGANELGTRFYVTEPFFAYRSIERAERMPRLRRYGRAVAYSGRRRPARFGEASVRVNDECRSYHLGWILYVWSGRVGNDGSRVAESSTAAARTA